MISSNMLELLDNIQVEGTDEDMEIMNIKKLIKKEKKKQDAINKNRLLKQQQLSREIKIGRSNAKRLGCIWRQRMKEMKALDLKMNVEITRGKFDHVFDSKDNCGSLLLECLDQCEEQYQRNINHHMDIIKKFERIYDDRLEAAKSFYNYNLSELLEETNSEIKKINVLQNDDKIFLETLIFQGKAQQNSILDNLASEHFCKLENLKNTSNNETKTAMVRLAENISSTWESLNAVLSKYLRDIEDRQVSYLYLKAKDDKSKEIINKQLIETDELTDFILKTRTKMINYRDESEKKVIDMVVNQCSPIQKTKKLFKKLFDDEQTRDKFQLNLLTSQYNFTMQHLKKIKEKSSQVLSLIQSCQKLQLKEEKLYPVEVNRIEDEFDYCEFFWYQVALANTKIYDYQCRKKQLQEENTYLQECIKNRMNEYSF